MADKDKPPLGTDKIKRAFERLNEGYAPGAWTFEHPSGSTAMQASTLRQDIANAIEQSERSTETKAVSHGNQNDRTVVTYLDYSGLGAILFAIEEMGRRWFEEQPITRHHWVAFAAFMIAGAVALGLGRRIKNMPAPANQPLRSLLSSSFDAVAHNAITWLVTAAILIFGIPITFWAISPPLHAPPQVQTPTGGAQVQGFGFAEATKPPPKHPSKNYSSEEKRALSDLIGTISTLLNNKGLPAVQLARVTGYNAVSPSKNNLDDVIKRAESVRETLAEIQLKIFQDILQPKNSNYLTDLNYVIDSNAKLDQFQRATEKFLTNVVVFERNLDSLNQEQRNWIPALMQVGTGQVWGRSADEFQAWIQQCDSRMDTEREGLK